MSKTLKERIMDPLTIGLLCFLGGSLLTGGTIWGIQEAEKNKVKETTELVTAIGQLKDQLGEGQKQVMINLTDQDLLKDACSTEYIEKNGDLLCREMFCRMQNRGLDKGATQAECENISHITNSKHRLDTCMSYWGEDTILEDGGFNKNSKYALCMSVFENRE
jgi:hypothetical protein